MSIIFDIIFQHAPIKNKTLPLPLNLKKKLRKIQNPNYF